MRYTVTALEDQATVVQIEDESIIISDEQSALDVFMTIAYETGEHRFIVRKENFSEDFFDLSSKIAGGVLQKLMNYRMKLAIVGDFSSYSSKALKDFICECNNGNDIFFVESESEALSLLSSR